MVNKTKPKKIFQKNKKLPKTKQMKVFKLVSENGGYWGKAIIDAGYSQAYAKNPKKLLSTIAFADMMENFLPDYKLLSTHNKQLTAKHLDHMVFPLGPDDQKEDEPQAEEELEAQPQGGALLRRHELKEFTTLTDEDIKIMLEEVGCNVRKIVHGEQARHVYFWAADNKSQLAAVKLAYEIKNKMPQNKPQVVIPVQVNVNEDRQKYA